MNTILFTAFSPLGSAECVLILLTSLRPGSRRNIASKLEAQFVSVNHLSHNKKRANITYRYAKDKGLKHHRALDLAFRAGATSAATAGIFYGLGSALDWAASSTLYEAGGVVDGLVRVAGHAVTSGVLADAQGGNFADAAAMGGLMMGNRIWGLKLFNFDRAPFLSSIEQSVYSNAIGKAIGVDGKQNMTLMMVNSLMAYWFNDNGPGHSAQKSYLKAAAMAAKEEVGQLDINLRSGRAQLAAFAYMGGYYDDLQSASVLLDDIDMAGLVKVSLQSDFRITAIDNALPYISGIAGGTDQIDAVVNTLSVASGNLGRTAGSLSYVKGFVDLNRAGWNMEKMLGSPSTSYRPIVDYAIHYYATEY